MVLLSLRWVMNNHIPVKNDRWGSRNIRNCSFPWEHRQKNCTHLHRCNVLVLEWPSPPFATSHKRPAVFSPYGLLFFPWKLGNLTEPGSEWSSVQIEVHFKDSHHQSLFLLGVPGNCKSNIRYGVFLGKGRNVTENFPAVRNALLNH